MSLHLKVFDGTPKHEGSLCFGCVHSQVVKGQQVSDITVYCQVCCEFPRVVPKPVAECSEFRRKTDGTRDQMEKMAWILETKKGRPIGFVNPIEHKYRVKDGTVDDED